MDVCIGEFVGAAEKGRELVMTWMLLQDVKGNDRLPGHLSEHHHWGRCCNSRNMPW
jgi:hypothetical protein